MTVKLKKTDNLSRIITRQTIAKWYDLSERGLRNRMQKANFKLKHRSLTLTDLEKLFEAIDVPPNLPKWLVVYYVS